MYHDLPINAGLKKLYKFFFFALSIAFLRGSVRTVSAYVLQVSAGETDKATLRQRA